MLPSPAEIESARRALKAIQCGDHPTQPDTLVLRLWAGPHVRMPLTEIAHAILEMAQVPLDPPAPPPP